MDITEWFDEVNSRIQYYKKKEKKQINKFKVDGLISNFIKGMRGEHDDDKKRNDVCIYETILYPPGSKSPNKN